MNCFFNSLFARFFNIAIIINVSNSSEKCDGICKFSERRVDYFE